MSPRPILIVHVQWVKGCSGRTGYPLIFLNSDAASFVTGEVLTTDGGTAGGVMTGRIDLAKILSEAMG